MSESTGSATFNTFVYLRAAAMSLFQSGLDQPDEAAYCRVAAVLFATFSVEATLNRIGEEKLPEWNIIERKLSWEDKFKLIESRLAVSIDRGKPPFQVLTDLFRFRDRLAHGKTHLRGADQVLFDQFANIDDPDWLGKFTTAAAAKQVIDDTEKIIEFLLEKSGLPALFSHPISRGAFFMIGEWPRKQSS